MPVWVGEEIQAVLRRGDGALISRPLGEPLDHRVYNLLGFLLGGQIQNSLNTRSQLVSTSI